MQVVKNEKPIMMICDQVHALGELFDATCQFQALIVEKIKESQVNKCKDEESPAEANATPNEQKEGDDG